MDHLQDAPTPYVQIKGVNKEAVAAAGSTLKLDGSYTTKVVSLTLLKFNYECLAMVPNILFHAVTYFCLPCE